jgi:biopolymer transport protein ExbB
MMTLTERFMSFTLLGAEWVLWLLLILSVISIGVMIERGLFFLLNRVESAKIIDILQTFVSKGEIKKAISSLDSLKGTAATVLKAGLQAYLNGNQSVEEEMNGVKTKERLRLEKNIAILGTLGNNAPFIGLFGTVLGIIKAFHDLSLDTRGGASAVMAGISEALVATAIGLLVAIPAVVAFNYFQRKTRRILTNIEAFSYMLVAQLKSNKKG